jgi:hypothetical protein
MNNGGQIGLVEKPQAARIKRIEKASVLEFLCCLVSTRQVLTAGRKKPRPPPGELTGAA